jgi:DNA-binding IscR family transcriptional regulator
VKIGVDGEMLEPVLRILENKGYLERLEDEDGAFLPAVPLDVTQVAELLEDVRGMGDIFPVREEDLFHNGMALGILQQIAQAGRQSLNGQTIKDLIEADEVSGQG